MGRAGTCLLWGGGGDECEVPKRMQASVRGCTGAIDPTAAFRALQDVVPVSSLTSSPATLPFARSNPATLAFPSSQCAKRSLPPGLCTCCFRRPECPPHSFVWLALSQPRCSLDMTFSQRSSPPSWVKYSLPAFTDFSIFSFPFPHLSFIHKHLLSSSHVPDTILDTGETMPSDK